MHQDVSVVLAVSLMLLQLRLPKSQNVPVKSACSQILLKLSDVGNYLLEKENLRS